MPSSRPTTPFNIFRGRANHAARAVASAATSNHVHTTRPASAPQPRNRKRVVSAYDPRYEDATSTTVPHHSHNHHGDQEPFNVQVVHGIEPDVEHQHFAQSSHLAVNSSTPSSHFVQPISSNAHSQTSLQHTPSFPETDIRNITHYEVQQNSCVSEAPTAYAGGHDDDAAGSETSLSQLPTRTLSDCLRRNPQCAQRAAFSPMHQEFLDDISYDNQDPYMTEASSPVTPPSPSESRSYSGSVEDTAVHMYRPQVPAARDCTTERTHLNIPQPHSWHWPHQSFNRQPHAHARHPRQHESVAQPLSDRGDYFAGRIPRPKNNLRHLSNPVDATVSSLPHCQIGVSVEPERCSLRSSSLFGTTSHRAHPAQLHVEALNLPSNLVKQIYARLTYHDTTLACTECTSSRNPMFTRAFEILPPHVHDLNKMHRVLESQRERNENSIGGRYASDMSPSSYQHSLDCIYTIHLHSDRLGDLPFASVPVPLRELAENAGQRVLIPLFVSGNESHSSTVSSLVDTCSQPQSSPSIIESNRPHLALTFEPLVPGGERVVHGREIDLAVRMSALRRRGKVLGSRVRIVIAVYRQTSPKPPVKPRWVLLGLTNQVAKAHHGGRYMEWHQKFSYASICNGEPHRALRIAVYRQDGEGVSRVICFHETSLIQLEQAAVCGGQPLPLRGRRQSVGCVRTFAVPSTLKRGGLGVTIQMDLDSTQHYVSSTARTVSRRSRRAMEQPCVTPVPNIRGMFYDANPHCARHNLASDPSTRNSRYPESNKRLDADIDPSSCMSTYPPSSVSDAYHAEPSGLFQLEKVWADRERTARNTAYS